MLAERIDFFLFHDSWKCEKKKKRNEAYSRRNERIPQSKFVVSRIIN